MPETICQICGTPNPPDAVICSMCHSRLGPLPGRTQSLETPEEQSRAGQENLDWLNRVRELNAQDQLAKNGSISPAIPPSIPTPSAEVEVDNPDWLHNTRDLTAAQKPPAQAPAGEDLSWLNDLRASTGSLAPPPEIPTTAAEVLAAAAFAKHQEQKEETENLGETQQLTPVSSIPGSASDWMDKLGAAGEEEPLKPGFEENFGSPPLEVGSVVDYDIERATGSLGKPSKDEKVEPPPPPARVETIPPVDVSVAGKPILETPVVPEPVQASTPAADLDFLDSLLSETPTASTPPPAIEPSSSPTPEFMQPAEPAPSEPSLSWLQDLQNQTGVSQIEAAEPAGGISEPVPSKPPEPQVVAPEIAPLPSNVVQMPTAAPSPIPVIPPQVFPEVLEERLINQFGSSPATEVSPPAVPTLQPPQELKSMPGFSSTGLTGLLGSNALAEMGMEGILPPQESGRQSPATPPSQPAPSSEPLRVEIPPAPTPVPEQVVPPTISEEPSADFDPLFHPPESSLQETPISVQAAPEVQSVDLGSLQPSVETPEWLKQYGDEFKGEEKHGSLFPSQEALSKEPQADISFTPAAPSHPAAEEATGGIPTESPPTMDFAPSDPQPVIPAAAEIQNQDWLNNVINETPASPADLFKDVEEPRFAAPVEDAPPEPAPESKPAAWSMEPGQHSGFTGPLPDWLQELDGDQEGKAPTADNQEAQEEIISDHFTTPPLTPESNLEAAVSEPVGGASALPDVPGLADLGIQTEDFFKPGAPPTEEPKPSAQPSLEDLGIKTEDFFTSKESGSSDPLPQPDWLSNLPAMQDEVRPAPAEPEPQPEKPKKENQLGATASLLGAKAAGEAIKPEPARNAAAPSPAVPFGLESLPDWISAEHGEGESPDSSDQPALAQAEMPGWLEALKPVGMVKAALTGSQKGDTSKTPVTGALKPTTGSLGGKPSASAPSPTAPPAPAAIQTETQKQYAAMMEQVLTRGPTPAASAPGQKKRSRKLLWIVISIFAVILLLILAAVGLGFLPLPQLFSAETVTFYNTVETLPPDAPVLVALEYSPAFAAELQPISDSTMQQLALKNARVSFISTQPAGPILVEQLLQKIHQTNPAYDLAVKTANLGYLAGSSTALQGFAIRPASITQTGWDGQPAWSKPALTGIDNLGQFAVVLVISESADISRDWIEQVQPKMGTTPLLIATSAQTGPLLQPYTASGQVKGLVAGISGAAAYENILGKPAGGSALWRLSLVGQILAILVILLGLALRFTRDRKQQPDGEG